MRILLTGKNGQVGWELMRSLATIGHVAGLDRSMMDLSDPDSIRSAIRDLKPNLIVNAAAYTAVDKAESEPEPAFAVNGAAPGVMAEEAKRIDAAIIHYSTDYVFDGTKKAPYTEEDTPNPVNVYGRSKLAGEQAVQAADVPYYIFRTSWVYGARGNNFLGTMLKLAKERDELRIVKDQISAPTWSRTIAEITAQILARSCLPHLSGPPNIMETSGLYNLCAAGSTSWNAFARAIFNITGPLQGDKQPRITPIATSEYPTPARRPLHTHLSTEKLEKVFGLTCPDWCDMLALCLE